MDGNQEKLNQGFVIAFFSAIILSFTGILIRLVSEDYQLPALILAFWRDIFVVLCAFPFFIFIRPTLLRIKKKHILFLIAYGSVLALFNILWTLAVTLTGASIATVLVYSSTGFTALLGWLFLKEILGWTKVLAVILCLVGCLFVSGAVDVNAWQTNTLGILSGALSGLLYAMYNLFGRYATQRGLNPWTTLFYTFLIAALILLLINVLPLDFIPKTASRPMELLQLGSQWRGWGLLILLAAGPTLIGFGLLNVSLGMLPSSTVNLILTLEPVVTGIVAFFLLGERLTHIELIGSGLILTALFMVRLRSTVKPRNENLA
jgi:drug/metabolite transporter (DMT)-like permease